MIGHWFLLLLLLFELLCVELWHARCRRSDNGQNEARSRRAGGIRRQVAIVAAAAAVAAVAAVVVVHFDEISDEVGLVRCRLGGGGRSTAARC